MISVFASQLLGGALGGLLGGVIFLISTYDDLVSTREPVEEVKVDPGYIFAAIYLVVACALGLIVGLLSKASDAEIGVIAYLFVFTLSTILTWIDIL